MNWHLSPQISDGIEADPLLFANIRRKIWRQCIDVFIVNDLLVFSFLALSHLSGGKQQLWQKPWFHAKYTPNFGPWTFLEDKTINS